MSPRFRAAAALVLVGALSSGCGLAPQAYAPVQQLRATSDWEDAAQQVVRLTRASNLWDPGAIEAAIGVPLRHGFSWPGCQACGTGLGPSVPRDDYASHSMAAAPLGSVFRYSRFFNDGQRNTVAGFSLSFRLSEAAPCDFFSLMEAAFRAERGTEVVRKVPDDRLEQALPVVGGVTARRADGRSITVFAIGQGALCRIAVQIQEGAALNAANWSRGAVI